MGTKGSSSLYKQTTSLNKKKKKQKKKQGKEKGRERRELGYRRISALHGQATKPAREISENSGAPFQLTWYL